MQIFSVQEDSKLVKESANVKIILVIFFAGV